MIAVTDTPAGEERSAETIDPLSRSALRRALARPDRESDSPSQRWSAGPHGDPTPAEADVEATYAALARSLGRYRDFCVALALALFFGRSLWAWVSGRSWIVGPDIGALHVIGFPALFIFLSARELPVWLRLWSARRLARRRSGRNARPWQYVAIGALIGASVMLVTTVILRRL
jgi:hypothetical protein